MPCDLVSGPAMTDHHGLKRYFEQMTSYYKGATVALYLLGTVLTAAPLASQTPDCVTREPAELLAAYVREHEALERRFMAEGDLIHILLRHSTYPAGDVETLLRGLEDLALTSSAPRLRALSVPLLAVVGSHRVTQPLSETYSRLIRIYRGSQDPLVRMMVINAMGDLAVRSRAAAFLEGVAARDPKRYVTEPDAALGSLLRMDEEGRAALMRLHETGAVQHRETRYRLELLARQWYQPR
jgi:hypothetical protein